MPSWGTPPPKSSASIAVVIVNWNSGDMLRRTLECLKRQTYPPAAILVVDNASADNSVSGVLPDAYPNCEIVRLKENTGFAAANNFAISRLAGYDWIALLNPDAFPEPDWLEKLIASSQRNPDCQMFASCQLLANDPTRFDGLGDVYHVSGLHWRRRHGQRIEAEVEDAEVFSACAAAALFRADVLHEVGGFDSSFFCYAEDVDLGFRMRLRGYRCRVVPDAVVRHVGSASTGRGSDFSVYHGHRNLVWVYFKNMPMTLLLTYLPQHVVLNLVSIIWFTSRGQGRVMLKAKWDAMKGLPRVLRQRKETQRSRKVSLRELRRAMVKGFFAPYFRRLPYQ